MIDINKPLGPNQDMILNFDGKEARLGSSSEFEKAVEAGKLISLPGHDNPNGDPNSVVKRSSRRRGKTTTG
jgi:hypothetical protein